MMPILQPHFINSTKLNAMKTLLVLLCVLGICTLGLAQDYAYPQLKPGVKYVFHTPEGQLNIDNYPPANIDPWGTVTVNPAFMNNIDGSGPIALNHTAIRRMNPYLLFNQDYMDPGQSPIKRNPINPAFLHNHDGFEPIVPDPRAVKSVNPAFQNWHD